MALKVDLKEKGKALAHFLKEYRDLLVAYYELDEGVVKEATDKVLKVRGDNADPYYMATICNLLCKLLEK